MQHLVLNLEFESNFQLSIIKQPDEEFWYTKVTNW